VNDPENDPDAALTQLTYAVHLFLIVDDEDPSQILPTKLVAVLEHAAKAGKVVPQADTVVVAVDAADETGSVQPAVKITGRIANKYKNLVFMVITSGSFLNY